jgi:hypothetical protein
MVMTGDGVPHATKAIAQGFEGAPETSAAPPEVEALPTDTLLAGASDREAVTGNVPVRLSFSLDGEEAAP